MRWSAANGVLAGCAFVLAAACGGPPSEKASRAGTDRVGTPGAGGDAAWVDVTASAGVDFVHRSGRRGAFRFPEITGSGAAAADFDGDGDLDLFFVQGGEPPHEVPGDADAPAAPAASAVDERWHRVYANQGSRRGAWRFVDISERAGIGRSPSAQGVAAADVDGDGAVDLYLTHHGPNELWLGRGDGSFVRAEGAAGADEARWSLSASFFDYDRDGWLDLWVTNYARWTTELAKPCFSPRGRRDYCGPMSYEGVADTLYRNVGGRFVDVSLEMGISGLRSTSMGVVAADFDRDGWLDVYVANDQRPNHLWRNLGGGGFEENAMISGAAVNAAGLAESSMGVDTADFDGDLDLDLVLTHLGGETNTVYRNEDGAWFSDRSLASGMAAASLPRTGFGVAFLDADRDGALDLAVVNGAVRLDEALELSGDPWPYRQAHQLFRGVADGSGTFEEVTARSGSVWELSTVGRGLLRADLDEDGDSDLVVTSNDGPAIVLENRAAPRPWLGVRALTKATPGSAASHTTGGDRTHQAWRDALGALVVLEGGQPVLRRIAADGSYLCAHDPRALFALGGGEPRDEPAAREPQDTAAADTAQHSLLVVWPSGRSERFQIGDAVDSYVALREGEGTPGEPPW
ncbi:MAG: CRTAC1 family protein [Acidobacteria bacterium]|nr:MAG: CRTAC1 family protein [Acidobacteriota bacterium]REK08668.1 MAG: CRTAC1 family protein [Acidobacteriota bacterium]